MIDLGETFEPVDDAQEQGWPIGPEDNGVMEDYITSAGGGGCSDNMMDQGMSEEQVWPTTVELETIITDYADDNEDASVGSDAGAGSARDHMDGYGDDEKNSKPEGWLLVEQGPDDDDANEDYSDETEKPGYAEDELDPDMLGPDADLSEGWASAYFD